MSGRTCLGCVNGDGAGEAMERGRKGQGGSGRKKRGGVRTV